MKPPVAIVAAVIRDADGRVLLCRKRGTGVFMQPGGKREPGEDDLAALARELGEEIGCVMDARSARALGRFEAEAAHEQDRRVEAVVYEVAVAGKARALAEIEALAWVDPAAPGDLPLAALTRDFILPAVARRGAPPA